MCDFVNRMVIRVLIFFLPFPFRLLLGGFLWRVLGNSYHIPWHIYS